MPPKVSLPNVSAAKRDPNGRWLAGDPSPNPKGRGQEAYRLDDLAKAHTPEAIAGLDRWILFPQRRHSFLNMSGAVFGRRLTLKGGDAQRRKNFPVCVTTQSHVFLGRQRADDAGDAEFYLFRRRRNKAPP